MQTCPDCHALVEDQLIFCDNCGFRLVPEEKELHSHLEEPPAASVEAEPRVEQPTETAKSVPQGACSACGYINLPGETFCNNCGVQLAPVISVPPPPPIPIPTPSEDQAAAGPSVNLPPGVCSYCGYTNDPEETFCLNCGLQLSKVVVATESPPVTPSPVETEVLPSKSTIPLPQSEPLEEVEPESIMGKVWGKLIVEETGAEITLSSGKSEILLGRTDPVRNIYPDVDLTLHGGELNGVSRMHARLEMQGNEITIEDLNSTNYTFLNRQKLEPGQRYPIQSGDEIRLGLLRMEYLVS